MKYGCVIDNKIVYLYDDAVHVNEGLKELPDNAKIGDVYDSLRASREDNLATEMPTASELIEALWKAIVNNDTTDRDLLEARRQLILAKYPLQD